MILARGKNGQLGRQIQAQGLQAKVAPASQAGYTRSMIVSNRSINEDHAREQALGAQANKKRMQQAQKSQAKAVSDQRAFLKNRANVMSGQRKGGATSQDRQLAAYFGRQANQSETERMNRSMKADFTENEELYDPDYMRVISPRADFKIDQIKGSPITNSGSFGPSTDYDRFVKGTELDNDKIAGDGAMIIGGTMLGRYDGKTIGFAPKRKQRRMRNTGYGGFGDDGSDDSDDSSDDSSANAPVPGANATDFTPDASLPAATPAPAPAAAPGFFSSLVTGLEAGATAAIPGAVTSVVTAALSPAQAAAKAAAVAAAPNPLAKFAASMGVPAWYVYAGVGVIGVVAVYAMMRK